MTRQFLTARQVAAALNQSLPWFRRHRAALEADGFPPPAFGTAAGARWDSAAIDAWADRKIRRPANDAQAADPETEAAAADIDARLAALMGAA